MIFQSKPRRDDVRFEGRIVWGSEIEILKPLQAKRPGFCHM